MLWLPMNAWMRLVKSVKMEKNQPLYPYIHRHHTSPYHLFTKDRSHFLFRYKHVGDWNRMLRQVPHG
jgi:hypothetical protein